MFCKCFWNNTNLAMIINMKIETVNSFSVVNLVFEMIFHVRSDSNLSLIDIIKRVIVNQTDFVLTDFSSMWSVLVFIIINDPSSSISRKLFQEIIPSSISISAFLDVKCNKIFSSEFIFDIRKFVNDVSPLSRLSQIVELIFTDSWEVNNNFLVDFFNLGLS